MSRDAIRRDLLDKLDALWSLCDESDTIVVPWRDAIRAELTRLWAIEDAAVETWKRSEDCPLCCNEDTTDALYATLTTALVELYEECVAHHGEVARDVRYATDGVTEALRERDIHE